MLNRSEKELADYAKTHKRCPLFLKCVDADDEGWCYSFNPETDSVDKIPCFTKKEA